MKNTLCEIVGGLKSLFIGMRITIGQFFKPTITVHYPHQTLKIPPRYRGHIELVRDPSTGKAICFACKLCERACPSDCISVEGVKLEGAKKRSVASYKLDFTKCSLCGSCVEACRDQAIRFSREYNLAGWKKEEFIMDLFKRLEDQSRAAGTELIMPAGAGLPSATPPPAAATKPAAAPGAFSSAPQPAKTEPAKAAAAPVEVK